MQRKDNHNKEDERIEEISDYYNSISEGYNQLHEQEQLEKIYEIVNNFPFSFDNTINVLDVGCGTGISMRISHLLSSKKINVREIIGIDPSEGLLRLNPFNTIKAPAENIPFKSNEFNLVISLTAAQNFVDMKKAIDEIVRVGNDKFVLTILKGSKKKTLFEEIINKKLHITKIVNGKKDLIIFAEKK